MAKINRNQFKNTYKIPRSLKKSIKQNLNKIVKRREREIRDEEVCTLLFPSSPIKHRLISFFVLQCKRISIDIETRLADAHGHCNALDHLLQTFDMSSELAHALDDLLISHWSHTNIAVERQRAAMKGKKAFARQVLSKEYLTREMKTDMILWKGEELDEDVEVNDGDVDGKHGSGTNDKDDWSPTSTLA